MLLQIPMIKDNTFAGQVLWLEEYLMRWKKTLVVVSHDRDFLNNVTTDIIHLHDLGLHFYRFNAQHIMSQLQLPAGHLVNFIKVPHWRTHAVCHGYPAAALRKIERFRL